MPVRYLEISPISSSEGDGGADDVEQAQRELAAACRIQHADPFEDVERIGEGACLEIHQRHGTLAVSSVSSTFIWLATFSRSMISVDPG